MNEYVNSLGAAMDFRWTVPHIDVSTSVSLTVIFGVLLLSMLFSFFPILDTLLQPACLLLTW